MEDNKIYGTENYEVVEGACVPAEINCEEKNEKKVNTGKIILRGAEAGLAVFGAFVLVKKLVCNIKKRRSLKNQIAEDSESADEDVKG